MNILDSIALTIFIFCLIEGYFKGALQKSFDILGVVLSFILFRIFQPFINSFFFKSSFYEKVKNWILEDLNFSALFETVEVDLANPAQIESLNIPNIIKEQLLKLNNEELFSSINANSPADYIIGFISTIIISIISIVIIMILVYAVINILFKFGKFLTKLPILGKVNKFSGIILGAINGIIILWVLGFIVNIIAFFPSLSWLKDQLNNSKIASPIFENNYLIDLLMYLIVSILK